MRHTCVFCFLPGREWLRPEIGSFLHPYRVSTRHPCLLMRQLALHPWPSSAGRRGAEPRKPSAARALFPWQGLIDKLIAGAGTGPGWVLGIQPGGRSHRAWAGRLGDAEGTGPLSGWVGACEITGNRKDKRVFISFGSKPVLPTSLWSRTTFLPGEMGCLQAWKKNVKRRRNVLFPLSTLNAFHYKPTSQAVRQKSHIWRKTS